MVLITGCRNSGGGCVEWTCVFYTEYEEGQEDDIVLAESAAAEEDSGFAKSCRGDGPVEDRQEPVIEVRQTVEIPART